MGQQLASGACAECDSLSYFADLSGHDRLQALIHNWRVANYVNDTSLAEGQYGYPGRFGFVLSRDVGAWQDLDGNVADNAFAIPPEVTVLPAQRVHELSFSGMRGSAGCSDCDVPMKLNGFGAEYWVVKSDPTLALTDQDLMVRVAPEATMCTAAYVGRLMVSAIVYSQDSDTLNSLWRHPEWAEAVIGPVSIDQSNRPFARPIELEVPHFGSAAGPKAAVIVITLEEGPTTSLSSSSAFSLRTTLPYALALSLPVEGCSTTEPIAITSAPDTLRRFPAWSPSGQEIVFMALDGDGRQRIFRKSLVGGAAVPLVQPSPGYAQSRPDWSPRGDWVCYEQYNVFGKYDLWIHNVLTSETRRLFGGPPVGFDRLAGSFSPNGQELAYFRQDGSVNQLHRVNLDGTGDSLLATYPANETPRWSPNGDRIFLRSSNSSHPDTLFAVSADSSGLPVPLPDLLKGALPFFGYDFHATDGPIVYGAMDSIPPPSGPYFDLCAPSYQHVAFLDTSTSTITYRFSGTRRWCSEPRWAPDGMRVVFRTRPDSVLGGDVAYGYVGCNRPPTLATVRDTTIQAGTQFALDLAATDPDGDAITFRDVARYRPIGATLNSNGQFRWMVQTPGDHFLVFRALDDAGGVSSQVVKFTVAPGGSGCPFADTRTAEGWQVENSILGRSSTGTPALDAYRLKATPAAEGGRYQIRLRENEREITTLDQVRLVAVDHSPDLRPYPIGDRVVLGTRVRPYRVTTSTGADITSLVDGSTPSSFQGEPGDTLLVELVDPRNPEGSQTSAAAAGDVDPIEMDIGGKEFELQHRPGADLESIAGLGDAAILDNTGILVQGQDAAGIWRTVRHPHPRAQFDEAVVDTLDQGPVRLVFLGSHALRFIGRVIPVGDLVTPQRLDLVAARHTRLGPARSAILSADGVTTALAPGDTLNLEFAATSVPPGQVRDFFLFSHGVYTTMASGIQGETVNDVPVTFALLQNQPNPFLRSTTIRFDLPHPTAVKLEVFDLQGRLLTRIAEGAYTAGRWSATWDRHDSRGHVVPPAVYLYRITAGSYRDQKKMVLLP